MRDDVKRLGGLRDAGKGLEGQGEPEGIGAARGVAYFDGTGRVSTRTAEQVQDGAAAPAVPETVVAQVSNEVQGESAGTRPAAQGVQLSDFDKAVQASYDTLKAGEWPEYQSLSGITGLFDCTTGEGVRLAFGETSDVQQLPVYRSNCRQGLKPGWDSVSAYREEMGCAPDPSYSAGQYISIEWQGTSQDSFGATELEAALVQMNNWQSAAGTYTAYIYRGYDGVLRRARSECGALWQYPAPVDNPPNSFDIAELIYVGVDNCGHGAAGRIGPGMTPGTASISEASVIEYLDCNGSSASYCNPDSASLIECDQDFEQCENGETDPEAEDCNPLNLITNPCDLNPNEPYTCEAESEWDSADCYREEKRGGLKAGWDSVSAYREEIGCAPVEGFVAGEYYGIAIGGTGFYNFEGGFGIGASPEAALLMAAEKAAPNSWGAVYVGRHPNGQLYWHAGVTGTVSWNLGGYFNAEIIKVWNDPNGYIGQPDRAPFGGAINNANPYGPVSCDAYNYYSNDPDFIAWCALTEAPIECEQYLEQCENGETDPNAEDCNPLELTQAQQCCPDPATVEPCDWQDDCLADYLVSDTHRISPNPNDPNANLPDDISAAQFCDNEGNDVRLIPAKDGGYIVSNQSQNVNFYRDPAGKVSYFDNTKILDYQA